MSKLISEIQKRYTSVREIPHNVFFVSQLPYCSRKIYYQKVDPKEPEARLQGIFAIGTAVHEFIQKRLADSDLLDQTLPAIEGTVVCGEKDWKLIGHYDLLLKDRVVDIKTANQFSFKKRLAENEASYHHRVQANMYAALTGKDYYSILYVDKNDFSMIEFVYPVSQELFDETITKVKKIFQALQDGHPPAPDPREEWECRYCEYRELCESE